jgi:tetratricopeptide (TPR) repeat protein
MVTGQRPYSAPDFISMGYKHATERPTPPRRINAQIPIHVERAILKALAKERSDRYRDVAAFLTALQTLSQTTKEGWLREGNALYDLKRYEEALEAFGQALQLDPNFAEACINKGTTLYNLKRYEEALLAYEQAIQIDHNNARAHYGKSLTLDRLGRSRGS